MDVERIAVFAGVGFALVIGAFVLWGPAPRPRRRGRVAAITNLGYTCFLNALLQSLASCPTFTAWLRRQRDKNKDGSFTSTLISVLEKINGFSDDLYGDVTPTEIITSLGPLWSFAPGHQDAHELFHVALSALQAEAQSTTRKGCLSDALPQGLPIISDMKGSGDPLGLRSVSCNDIALVEKEQEILNASDKNCDKDCMARSIQSVSKAVVSSNKPGMILARSSEILSRNDIDNNTENTSFRPWNSLCTIPLSSVPTLSNEVHPFSGLLTSQLQCTNCNWKSSVRYDKLESLSLPLPPAGGVLTWSQHTLADLFSRLVTSELIHDVQCDGCASRCPAVKTLTLGKLPKCLCLHIPRTTWSSSGMPIKRDDPVIFPEILVLDPFTFTEAKKRSSQGRRAVTFLTGQGSTQGKHRYRLRAVVEHRGPVDAGHFICYRQGNRPGQWMFTSDTTVECTSLTNVLCASPYLLFYERINGSEE